MAANIGHGHVFPRLDGVKARCGGPAMCSECARDYYRKMNPEPAPDWQGVILTAGEIADALVRADTFEEARNYICDAALAKIK